MAKPKTPKTTKRASKGATRKPAAKAKTPAPVAKPSVALSVVDDVPHESVDAPVGFEGDLELGPGEVERVRPDRVLLVAVDRRRGLAEGRADARGAKKTHDPVLTAVPVGPTFRKEANGKWTGSLGTETVHVAIVASHCVSLGVT
jgi:hypothetical protein